MKPFLKNVFSRVQMVASSPLGGALSQGLSAQNLQRNQGDFLEEGVKYALQDRMSDREQVGYD